MPSPTLRNPEDIQNNSNQNVPFEFYLLLVAMILIIAASSFAILNEGLCRRQENDDVESNKNNLEELPTTDLTKDGHEWKTASLLERINHLTIKFAIHVTFEI